MKKINGFLIFGIVITLGLLVYLLVVPKPQELDYTQYATEQWQNDKKDVLGEEEVAKQEEKEQKLKDLYQVKIENETVWLSQQQMAELFSTSRTNIIEHINNIYEEEELDKNSTCQNFRQVRKEGNRNVTREIPFYNLDMIISSTGEKLLTGAGKISHDKALEKAKAEYKKYQVKTISPVEQEYLNTIKEISKEIKKEENNN